MNSRRGVVYASCVHSNEHGTKHEPSAMQVPPFSPGVGQDGAYEVWCAGLHCSANAFEPVQSRVPRLTPDISVA